jgi:Raf kinase inhibitor-like YbhB/YbcL family protein
MRASASGFTLCGYGIFLDMHVWRACVLLVGLCLACCLTNPLCAQPASFMNVSSPEFAQGQPMPLKSSKAGGNRSPELLIDTVPSKAKTLAIIVDDPDAPSGLWTHWVLWNVPPDVQGEIGPFRVVIPEGVAPKGVVQGKNSFGDVRYDGPAPPSGTHRYFFHVFALDEKLSLAEGSSRQELEAAMQGHIVEKAEMYGTYSANP